MTRSSPASAPDDLFEAIATLLEPDRRAYFYQRMLYFRHLRPEDELLRLVEAIGLLALLIREAPHAVARERAQMAQLLETSLATIHAAGEAGQAYQQQLDGRLTRLPADLAQEINPEAIARVMTESLRQQFVQTGLPATAEALAAIAQQLTDATGQFQGAASQLHACVGMAEQAQGAIDRVTTSVANATDTARWAVAELRRQFSLECVRGVCLLCGAAWLLGLTSGVAFERGRGAEMQGMPQTIAVPVQQGATPSSVAESPSKKPTHPSAHDWRREPSRPTPHRDEAAPGRGTDMEHASNSDGTAGGSEDAKP